MHCLCAYVCACSVRSDCDPTDSNPPGSSVQATEGRSLTSLYLGLWPFSLWTVRFIIDILFNRLFFFTLNSAFIVDITVWGYFLLAVYSRVSFFHLLGSHRLQLGELNPFICTVMTPVFGFVSHFSFVIHSSVLYSLCFYPAWTSIQSFLPLHHYSNLECWSYFSINQFIIYTKHWQCLNIK